MLQITNWVLLIVLTTEDRTPPRADLAGTLMPARRNKLKPSHEWLVPPAKEVNTEVTVLKIKQNSNGTNGFVRK